MVYLRKNKTNCMNLLALTPCCVDYYPQIDKSYMGGNSLNVAAMWKKLDKKSNISVITCLGNDKNGKMINDFFHKIGIDTSRVYMIEGATACNQLRVDETGERFGIEGTWQGGLYETFFLSNDDWKWVSQQDIVAMPANNPNFQVMVEKKHKNQFLSVDYLDIENKVPIEETIDFTDIAFITARLELMDKYKTLAFARKKLLVVTLGALGSFAFWQGETYHQPALHVAEVIDTTGCGDAYQAAFALNFYITGNIKESMFAGAKAASQILQAWGGVGKVD
jgi:sugar/nucleoside kinase (ribokinase family)